tara:strand:- start:1060 stop:1407 length:348 start_codon:yes stop_codon:yes gene_type:complete
MASTRWEEVELSSGRKVKIKELTIDEMDDCKDVARIIFDGNELRSITGVNKARTNWLRKGLYGGDFKSWNGGNGESPPDSALKELTEKEKDECIEKVQEAQRLGEFKGSNTSSTS